MNKGYTLIEVIVAFAMFTILLGGALNLLVSAVQSQRYSLGIQEVVGEMSFVGEVMTRALRQAQKDLGPTCLTTRGWNYELTRENPPASGNFDGVKFIDRDGKCREFYLNTTTEQLHDNNITDGVDSAITSDALRVLDFRVEETGAFQGDTASPNNVQPRIVFLVEIESKKGPGVSRVQLQSTITQRPLDVRK